MHDDEPALLQRAARGDQAAYAALVARHEARLRHFLARIVGPGDADDLAQDTFVKAWFALPRYRGEASFGAWLTGIGWRAALDHIRRARRAQARDKRWHDDADQSFDGPGSAHVELQRALAALSEQERAALVLTHGHGWSHGEAAQILGLPLGTLKSLAARAKAKARAAIEPATEEFAA